MRIVQLAMFYAPKSGGLRTFVDEVGRRYGEAGHERVLVVPGAVDADEQTRDGRRIALAGPRCPVAPGYRMFRSRRRLLDLLDALRPDVLELDDRLLCAWAAPWARAHRVPTLLFAHERLDAALRDWVPRGAPLVRAADAVNRRLVAAADQVVVGSEFAAEEFRRIGTEAMVVPLGVDLDGFRPATVRRPGADRTVQLALVGRLSREKHPELAVEALRLLRAGGLDAGLLVLGDGPLRDRLERRAAGLPVRLLGHVLDRRSLARLVGSADVTVAPAPMETFGLAVLESLACGTPAVVPTAGAAREVVGTAGAVTDGTATGFAAGVLSVLAVPEEERRAAARARAERYPWSVTVDGLLAAHGATGRTSGKPAPAGARPA